MIFKLSPITGESFFMSSYIPETRHLFDYIGSQSSTSRVFNAVSISPSITSSK